MTADVLMIEDDADIALLAQHIAADNGLELTHTDSGARGADLAAASPALILLDLELPDLHGHDILRRLTGMAPVIVFTGTAATDRGSRRQGAIAHIRKPADVHDLERLLTAMLKGGKLITTTPGFDPDEVDQHAQAYPLGVERFYEYLGRCTESVVEAAHVFRSAGIDLVHRRAHQLRPHMVRLGRPAVAAAMEALEKAPDDEAEVRAACLAVVLERLANDLRRLAPIKV